ncbi:MAG: IS3 family transposase [Planctomycetes bacterium]|nr:IS3 family transposase [Planctomycetota bacterium]
MGRRGRRHSSADRELILAIFTEAVSNGARANQAAELLPVALRTIRRWQLDPKACDARKGPRRPPRNKLTEDERTKLLEIANSVEFRDRSPKQIVPMLLDRGVYIACESSMYRVLREQDAMKHRGATKPPTLKRPRELAATAPNQVWTWDITYLPRTIRGSFFYMYAAVDLFSRKIVGWRVEERESGTLACDLIEQAACREGIQRGQLTLHADNGGPQRGATLHVLLESLGIERSFSRPSQSNDNPFIESLFKTLKYRPQRGRMCFESVGEAREFFAALVDWYNHRHLHSAIRFVSPDDRHRGRDRELLDKRRRVLEVAKAAHPERWSRGIRDLDPVEVVVLNPAA